MRPQDLDFSTYEELFDHIIEVKEAGNVDLAKELFNSLTDKRQLQFIAYLESFEYEAHHYGQTSELLNAINFFNQIKHI